ncbi:hypothetical protein [Thermoflexibacter ruber]|nr:hypothetical protein [Thermoflexibacter ruber]
MGKSKTIVRVGNLLNKSEKIMLKKMVFVFLVCLIAISTSDIHAQSCAYKEYLRIIQNKGLAIGDQMKVNLSQGRTGYDYRTFYAGLKYIIVASSDDESVTDVDLYLYEADGVTLVRRDTETSALAIIEFTPSTTRRLQIVIKNHASVTPNFESTHRFIVAYVQ